MLKTLLLYPELGYGSDFYYPVFIKMKDLFCVTAVPAGSWLGGQLFLRAAHAYRQRRRHPSALISRRSALRTRRCAPRARRSAPLSRRAAGWAGPRLRRGSRPLQPESRRRGAGGRRGRRTGPPQLGAAAAVLGKQVIAVATLGSQFQKHLAVLFRKGWISPEQGFC
jgi:hypothetical protein